MTSGQDVSEYLDTFGLVKSFFFKFFWRIFFKFLEKKNEKKSKKKMSWCTDAPEDEVISLFTGLLANPDVPLSPDLQFPPSRPPYYMFTLATQCV
jgi:hypothetical protein